MSTRKDKDGGTELIDRPESKEETKEPRKYKVVLMNDDYTPMDFVVQILKQVFHLSNASATRIMLAIHNKGVGVAGTYTREIAETKAVMVVETAQQYGHPLQATIEPE